MLLHVSHMQLHAHCPVVFCFLPEIYAENIKLRASRIILVAGWQAGAENAYI